MSDKTLIISPLNSITFKEDNGKMQVYDNTLSEDFVYDGKVNSPVVQRFKNTDEITIQFISNMTTNKVELLDLDNNTVSIVSFVEKSTYSEFSVYEFILSALVSGCYKVRVTGSEIGEDDVVWISETFKIANEDEFSNYLKVEYYNLDNMAYLDYSTGIKHFFWINSRVFKYKPAGEIDTYNNLGNVQKTREVIQRVWSFESEELPLHLAIKFIESSALDVFMINDKAYVTEDKPEIEDLDNRYSVTITAELTQKNVIGLNSTHIQVIDPTQDDMVKNPSIEGAAGNVTIPVSAGYVLRHITIFKKTGSVVTIKAGTTPAGNDIFEETLDNITPKLNITVTELFEETVGGTLYFNISGVGATASIYTWQEQFKII